MLVIGLVGGVTVWAVSSPESDPSTSGPVECPSRVRAPGRSVEVGSPAPSFTLPGLDGGCFESRTYRGRPLVVNFWASWCHPCRTEFPLLDDARERYGDDRLEVIGVVYKDIASDAQRFAAEREVEWPLVLDDEGVVANTFGVSGIPQTFFIAADGTVVARVYGFTSTRDLDAEIQRTLRR
jgi:peroxiredoxin